MFKGVFVYERQRSAIYQLTPQRAAAARRPGQSRDSIVLSQGLEGSEHLRLPAPTRYVSRSWARSGAAGTDHAAVRAVALQVVD